MMKVNVRMNLSHFLNKPFEKAVIDKLEEIHNNSIIYYLTLWYEDGKLIPGDIKDFLIKYESHLHFKTSIKVGNELSTNDFIWFDIIDENNANKTDRVRFQYIYYNEESILKGLDEFHKCAKFCTSEKPPKRQKRNDYESSDSRKQTIHK
tara:strand:- start:2634 stop:3083 length:450 start_codon:yes stop_codon:yes gene_type:complete